MIFDVVSAEDTLVEDPYEHLPKSAARSMVAKAIKEGTLVRPTNCEECGNQFNVSGKIEGHHHWGYQRIAALQVIWLCKSCHTLCHYQNHPEYRKR